MNVNNKLVTYYGGSGTTHRYSCMYKFGWSWSASYFLFTHKSLMYSAIKDKTACSLYFNINTACINSSSRWYIKVFHNTWSPWRSLCIWIWAVDEWGPCLAEACSWWWHRLLMFVCKALTVQWVFCLLVCPGPSSGALKEYNGSLIKLITDISQN